MTFKTSETSSSIKALLTLFIEGKDVSKEDIFQSLDDIKEIDSLSERIGELYLISIFAKLSHFDDTSKLKECLSLCALQADQLSSDLCSQITLCKLHLSMALLSMKKSIAEPKDTFSHVKNLSYLDEIALLGVISFMCGLFLDSDRFLVAGQKIGELIISLINHSGEVDAFFLLDKGVYKKDSLRASVFILISIYNEVVESDKAKSVLPLLDPYQGGLFQSLDIEKRLLCRLLEGALESCKKRSKQAEKNEEVEGLLKQVTEGFSFTSSQHDKVGLGSVSFLGKIIVPSFGPHVLPLGKSDLYGLKPQLALSSTVENNVVSTWNRVASNEDYGNHWIHSSVTCLQKSLKIESFIWSAEAGEKLSLVFFLRSDTLKILDKVYRSGGLERASVETDKIDLEYNGWNIQMILNSPSIVEVIPLAGQEFFYNSDFIVSLPFISNGVLSIDVVMD